MPPSFSQRRPVAVVAEGPRSQSASWSSSSWRCWAPAPPTPTVRSDPLRVHDLFYHSWRVDIPFVSIHFTMPKQPGVLRVDNMNAPPGATSVMAIEGYHTVSMGATDLYDEASVVIAAFDGDVST